MPVLRCYGSVVATTLGGSGRTTTAAASRPRRRSRSLVPQGTTGTMPNVDQGAEPRLVIELNEQQRATLCDASGVTLESLRYSRAEAAGVALLASAIAAGHSSPACRRLI